MRAPVLAVGDGALGFWAAVRDVFPETTEQRCWFHVSANVLNALPKSVQPAARRALAEIRDAEEKAHAEAAVKAFADEFKAKWPKAVAKITDKPDALLAFYDMPAEHWVHLKTTNPIESMIEICREHSVNVKRWRDGQMALRWCAAEMVEAEKQFRKVNGFLHLPALRAALDDYVARCHTDRLQQGGRRLNITGAPPKF
jgi:transposase-like protein